MDGVVVGVLLYFEGRGVSVLRGSSHSTFRHQLVDLIVDVSAVLLVFRLALAGRGTLSPKAPRKADRFAVACWNVHLVASQHGRDSGVPTVSDPFQ